MIEPALRRATYEDVLAAPPDKIAEVIPGVLHLSPRAGGPQIAADILVPDLAGWRRERMPLLPRTAHITLTPDWVGEILSPRTARLDRTEKKPLYAKNDRPRAVPFDAIELELGALWADVEPPEE